MRYTRNLISLVIITMFVGLGSLFLITDQANAGVSFFCDIGITKVADPADDTPFDFTAPGGKPSNFTLMDPSNDSRLIDIASSFGKVVNVTEDVPEGWSLDDIVCDEPIGVNILDIPNGKSFECLTDSGSANCTFFNSEVEPIPTLSEWGLIAMAGLLGIVGFMVMRRRKATT